MLPFALDISDTILRLVTLERHRRSWNIGIRAELPLPTGDIVDGDIKQPLHVAELIRSLVDAAGTNTKHVTFALPERHTFVKLVALPKTTGGMEPAIKEALAQHFPYPPDELYWDWHRVGTTNSLGQTQALLGAAPRTTVDEYLHVVAEAGLQSTSAEIESVAIARSMLGPEPSDETVIILDLGRTRSTLILVDHGLVQFSSTLRYAGRELNQYISDELHITNDQAERAKTLFGLDQKRGKGLLRKALLPHIDAIVEGILDVEAFYQEHFPDHRQVQRILINGSGALLRGIDAELQTKLSHQVTVSPSWIFTELLKHNSSLPASLGFTYTTVLGLALKPFFTS